MLTRGRIGPRYASDLSAAQHLRGWKEWALPSVANFAIEMAETEEHKSNWRNPGWESPSSSSSSFADGSALTETGRTVTEVGKSRVGNDDRPGVPAQSERANSGRTELQLEWRGRRGEVVNATSSATAEATRRLRLNTLRLRMATRFPILNIEHTITSRIGELCQVLTPSVTPVPLDNCAFIHYHANLIRSDEVSDHPARAAERDGRPSGPRELKLELSSRRSAVRGLQPAQIKGHKFNPFLEAQASDHIFTGREIEASAR
jgi:hypothetical protein